MWLFWSSQHFSIPDNVIVVHRKLFFLLRNVMRGAGHKMNDIYSGYCRKHQCRAQSFCASLANLLYSTALPTFVKKLTWGSKNLWNCKESKPMVVCFTSAHFQSNASLQSTKELIPCVHYHILPPNQLTTPTHFQPTIMKTHVHSILIWTSLQCITLHTFMYFNKGQNWSKPWSATTHKNSISSLK